MAFDFEELFPKGFIPKKDTQQNEFLQKYPKYDGRGCLIAILDSGIDVSLPGLQCTSTGLPKVIDCFDFSGKGDVDISTIKEIGTDNILIGLSGRRMKIPETWKNPSGKWHLGIKNVSNFYAEIFYNSIVENKNPLPKFIQENKFEPSKPYKTWSTIVNSNPKMRTKDLAIDCIVWDDGKKWRACLVNPFCENLENAKVLTNFSDEHEYCYIIDEISCCVTIHNDANLLELFIARHSHGSHVAQVAAAHFPEQPERDGLAPGAQLVSMNISSFGVPVIEKTLMKCIELGVDIISFSCLVNEFVESAMIKLIKKMVNQHGIIIIKNAGNKGPFLSSMNDNVVGVYDELFIIGSIFTSDTKSIFHESEDSFSFVFPYSSKGPLSNGARGVTFAAPAHAIVDNAKWHPLKKDLFGGTSCATPIAAGSIACLLTALKENSMKYNPATIKMALSTAAFLPDGEDQLGFGNGIIQINSAFEYFRTFNCNLREIKFPHIFIKNKTDEKGIVIYKTETDQNIYDYCINIQTNKQMSWILKLIPENINQEYIQYPKIVTSNLFNVKIDTTSMIPGKIYYSEIRGFDSSNLLIGHIFHLPITVIVPEFVNRIQREISLEPPSIFKLILFPPGNSTKCAIRLTNQNNGKIEFEMMIKKAEHNSGKSYTFFPNGMYAWSFDIQWKIVFEIYIYQRLFIGNKFMLNANLQMRFEGKPFKTVRSNAKF